MRTLTALWVGVWVLGCAHTAPEPEPVIPPTVAAATFDSVWQIVNRTHFEEETDAFRL